MLRILCGISVQTTFVDRILNKECFNKPLLKFNYKKEKKGK